jgi:hypothetical protein
MDLTAIRIAPDGTHHLLGDRALYTRRFDEVLKFHPPGFAAVSAGGLGWHIDTDGADAYAARYARVFGFYEGLAAVASASGWMHVGPDGRPAYPARWNWTGNFQEDRCTVRDEHGRYAHIDPSGNVLGGRRWRYAGDYRDGLAVVQRDDGRCTHVNRDGAFAHGNWFVDLDVFHKGFARARDAEGWMHVDRSGVPIYARRFGAVEPFYNGQARVERLDGGREVVDERGEQVVELSEARTTEFVALSRDMVGFWKTQTICAAVELGVFESLPASSVEIAAACRLDPGRTDRLLRALEELRLVEGHLGGWRSTVRGAHLRRSHPTTLADAAVEYGRRFPGHWAQLPDAIRDHGEWRAPDIFREVGADPAAAVAHHRMLASYARHDYPSAAPRLELSGTSVLIDAGGGVGVFAELLLAAHPLLRVVLLDRPEVVRLASVRDDLRTRFNSCAADLLVPWPVRGDAVLLARVLHDWDEDRALVILRNARAALPTGGRLHLVEMVLPDRGAAGSLCDLHLLSVTGGQERTEREYRWLLASAEFEVVRIVPTSGLVSVIAGVAR